jgi:hypothetical protein
MKNHFIIIILLSLSLGAFGQEKENLNLLVSDSTWIKEVIKFPIGFAQEIKFEGFEDLRFPKGWSKKGSPTFWSYVWAWSMNDIEALTESEMEKNVQFYFDGLLGIGSNSQGERKLHHTTATFIKTEGTNANNQYIGKVNTFDTRYTNELMTLYVLADQYYCEEEKKAILLFRYSPKPFENAVWTQLKTVELSEDACEY